MDFNQLREFLSLIHLAVHHEGTVFASWDGFELAITHTRPEIEGKTGFAMRFTDATDYEPRQMFSLIARFADASKQYFNSNVIEHVDGESE